MRPLGARLLLRRSEEEEWSEERLCEAIGSQIGCVDAIRKTSYGIDAETFDIWQRRLRLSSRRKIQPTSHQISRRLLRPALGKALLREGQCSKTAPMT